MDAMDESPSCYNYPDAFFPDTTNYIHSWEVKWAISTCNDCPIKQLCAEYGMKWEVHGIWGGTLPRERANWRKANNRSIEYDRPFTDGKRVSTKNSKGQQV
jgi:hypothetical protein